MGKLIKLIVFDIDGCLSNDSHRRHLLPPKDGDTPHEAYDAYNERMHLDTPTASGQRALAGLHHRYKGDKSVRFLFLTARPVAYRPETTVWLGHNVLPALNGDFEQDLWMRPAGDLRPSPEFKIGILSDYIEAETTNGHTVEILAAYDDRTDVLNAYRDKGITCHRLEVGGEVCYHSGRSQFDFSPGGVALAEIGKPALPEHIPVDPTPAAVPVGSPELAEIAGIFDQMSDTLRSRAADYGYNAAKVAKVMEVFFPNGVDLKTAADHEAWHLFELIIVKLTRFVNSGLRHKDSVHDMAIYAGFVERLVAKHNIQIKK